MKYAKNSLITFSFFLSALFIGCTSTENENPNNYTPTEQDCIEYIIAIDESLGSVRNNACKEVSISKSIEVYIKSMNELDFKECPANFKSAFYRHINAWTNMLILTDKYPDLRGEMHDLFAILESGENADSFNPLLKNIWDTWGEVEEAMK